MSYGNCPVCGAPGVTRERRPNGNDECANGHTYPSASALAVKVEAEDINNLPPALRQYVHDLETNADPAGMVRENILIKGQNAMLRAYLAQCMKLPEGWVVERLGNRDISIEAPQEVGAIGRDTVVEKYSTIRGRLLYELLSQLLEDNHE